MADEIRGPLDVNGRRFREPVVIGVETHAQTRALSFFSHAVNAVGQVSPPIETYTVSVSEGTVAKLHSQFEVCREATHEPAGREIGGEERAALARCIRVQFEYVVTQKSMAVNGSV